MPDDTASAHPFYTGPPSRACGRERQVAVRGVQVVGLLLLPGFPFTTITGMREPARRRRLWTRIAAGVLTLLVVLLVMVAAHDPHPDLTRETIRAVQWSLQTQSVK